MVRVAVADPVEVQEPAEVPLALAVRDKMGRFRTKSLFCDFKRNPNYPAFYTLKDQDKGEYLSVRKLYLDICDPTEYEVAMTMLGSYEHWLQLCELKWFKPLVGKWRIELEAKLESESIRALMETTMDTGSRSRVSAAKLLLEKPWDKKASPLRGRPTNDQLLGYKKQMSEEAQEIDEDAERLGIPLK